MTITFKLMAFPQTNFRFKVSDKVVDDQQREREERPKPDAQVKLLR